MYMLLCYSNAKNDFSCQYMIKSAKSEAFIQLVVLLAAKTELLRCINTTGRVRCQKLLSQVSEQLTLTKDSAFSKD